MRIVYQISDRNGTIRGEFKGNGFELIKRIGSDVSLIREYQSIDLEMFFQIDHGTFEG